MLISNFEKTQELISNTALYILLVSTTNKSFTKWDMLLIA